jgi:small subunit ribosomal protein S9
MNVLNKGQYTEGIGRRKTSTARVRVFAGTSASTVNGKALDVYFSSTPRIGDLEKPFVVTGLEGQYYFSAKVSGGGILGQLEAIQLGISRALYKMDPELKASLRKNDLVTRDPRMVESKKYNFKKARKKPQFSKR